MRYESLVADAESDLRRIALILDQPYEDSMAQFHGCSTTSQQCMSAMAKWLPPTQGLGVWRAEMSPDDVALFVSLAGGSLEANGYELAGDGTHEPAISRRAAVCRDGWDAFIVRRRRKARRRLEVSR